MEIKIDPFKNDKEAHEQAKRLVDEGWENVVSQFIDDKGLNIQYYYNFANCPVTNNLYIFDEKDTPIFLNGEDNPCF